MIRLGLMTWSYVFSYGPDNLIDFGKNDLVQLVGKNGHGKSSIALILEEVLFNKNSKGIKKADILNRYSSSKKYSIGLTFTKDADVYTIQTHRGATQTVVLIHNGIDISAHTSTGTYKLIEEILGFDHKTFTQIVYQSSAYSLEFLSTTDANRKKFLIDLLNLSIYTRASDMFKAVAKEVSLESEKVGVKVKTLSSWLDKYIKEELISQELVVVPAPPTEELAVLAILKEQLSTIEDTNKRISKNNKYKEILGNIVLDIAFAPTTDITKLKIEEADLSKQIKTAQAVISGTGIISDICSMCKSPIDTTHKKGMVAEARALISRVQPELLVITNDISQAQDIERRFIKAQATQVEWEKYTSLIDPTMTHELLDKKYLETLLETGISQIDKINADIKKATIYNTAALAHNTKIEVMAAQMASVSAELIEETALLSPLTSRSNTLAILQKTFSTTGLVAYKIECLVKDLEQITNDYLLDMSDGRFQLAFKVNSSDKLNVIITDNGTDIDIQALSNGERARVNIATLLAIRKLMQTLSNAQINLLILDETVESLDIDGKEKLIEVLLKEQHLNTILVSHGFSHPLLEKINIIKDNHISRME